MSDDDSPDNVLRMPRIGSPPPPPVPPAPTLDEPPAPPDATPDGVRISVFDAPAVPHAPQAPDSVPAALRSDGLDPAAAAAPVPPPRTSALSLAAILAIALAAFEGLQTWIQESGPRRAEAAKHQREMELLAAKAGADATRLGAEADREHARGRRVPSSHDYGRSALGRGSGGAGRGGGGIGPGRSGTGRTGPYSGSVRGRSTGGGSRGTGGGRATGGRPHLGSTRSGTGPGRNGGLSGRNGTTGNRNGAASDRNSGPRARNGGTGGTGGGGTRTGGAGGASGSGGGRGRRSARQTVADWWGKGKKPSSGPGHPGSSGRSGAGGSTKASHGGTASKTTGGRVKGGPTFWDDLMNRVGAGGRSKPSRSTDGTPRNHGPGKPPTVGAAPGPGSRAQDRVHFKDAAWEAVNDRWKKRRDAWTAGGGPRRRRKNSTRDRQKDGSRRGRKAAHGGRTDQGGATGGGGAGPQGYGQPRSSPFDQTSDTSVTITVEQVDPPGAHAKRWEPTAIGPRQQALPKQGAPALPRAPQRPAGQRPATTRRKDPIPMPASSRAAGTVPAPVTASVKASTGIAAQHATDITLDDILKALNVLTTEGMETYDDCADLARKARRLLEELEVMAGDLAADHNVVGHRTMAALVVLMESVAQLAVQAERMARAALTAAELAEAEETALARDYRPTQAATIDAGLAAPSARLHNEN
ncbi:hypothetical protein [Streptomyces coelicoflavus]|uniref:hypothetical protein n=1 Tax=Streptomyces coelicoflavus TaxID=285562 RepID=UPI0036A0395E